MGKQLTATARMARLAMGIMIFLSVGFARGEIEIFHLESAGVRFGVGSSSRTRAFQQTEAFAAWEVPWRFDCTTHWHGQWRLNFSAGWIGANGDHACLGSGGPSLVFQRNQFPLTFEAGINAMFLGRSRFDDVDLGTVFQFTSYGGLNYDISRRFRIGYRFQHMSNAHISEPNPGVNMHVISTSWRF